MRYLHLLYGVGVSQMIEIKPSWDSKPLYSDWNCYEDSEQDIYGVEFKFENGELYQKVLWVQGRDHFTKCKIYEKIGRIYIVSSNGRARYVVGKQDDLAAIVTVFTELYETGDNAEEAIKAAAMVIAI